MDIVNEKIPTISCKLLPDKVFRENPAPSCGFSLANLRRNTGDFSPATGLGEGAGIVRNGDALGKDLGSFLSGAGWR
jgi:hypothetical protein